MAGRELPVDQPGAIGVIKDRPSWQMPPEAWTDGKNFRFKDGVAKRVNGWATELGDPTGVPVGIFNIPYSNNTTYWVVFTLAKAYVWESGVETEITNVSADYTATAAWQWTGTLLAGIPIFNNGIDKPQWWSSVSVSQELTDLTAWPATYRARVIRAFGPYLVAMNLTEGGTSKPHKVLISHKSDPGSIPSSWDVTDATKEATEFELTDAEGGELLDGLPLGNQFIFYKKNSTHTMRFVGGQDIWARDLLFEGAGILNTRCVCRANKGTQHFVATQNDIILHSGSKDSLKSVVEGKNKLAIFAEMDTTNYLNAFVFEDEKEKELYFCYPTAGNTYPSKAFIYNYENGTQAFKDLAISGAAKGVIQTSDPDTWASDTNSWDSDGNPWADGGLEGILFVDPTAEAIYRLNSGYAFGAVTPVAFLERTGLPLPPHKKEDRADFTTRKLCARIWPKISGVAQWSIQVGAQETRDGEVTWCSPMVFNPAVDQYCDPDVPANGRLLAVRFETQENNAGTLEGYNMDVSVIGKL